MNIPRNFVRALSILGLMLAVTLPSVHAFDGPEASPEKEQELLTVLRSDAPSGDKAIACKNLAIYGSSAAVADLANLFAGRSVVVMGKDCAGIDSWRSG